MDKALKQLNRNLTILFILDKILDTFLLFLVMLVLTTILKIAPIYPMAISLTYLTYCIVKQITTNKIEVVEKKYKTVDEKLRTASEYIHTDNRIAKELHSEVLGHLNEINHASFFSRKNYIKAFFIIVLSGLVFLSAPIDFNIEEYIPFESIREEIKEIPQNIEDGEIGVHLFTFEDQGANTKSLTGDLYGAASVAVLGDEELKIKIRPAGTELDVRNVQESDLPDFSEEYPREISSVSSETYSESINEEDIEIVKEYFNKISEIEN